MAADDSDASEHSDTLTFRMRVPCQAADLVPAQCWGPAPLLRGGSWKGATPSSACPALNPLTPPSPKVTLRLTLPPPPPPHKLTIPQRP